MKRWTLFWGALAASALVTGLLWWAGIPGGALLLLFPFAFWPGRRGAARHCPMCGLSTTDPAVHYCPRDGSKLE
jgi:hypothetical protein